ncbi:hypothetical protein [Candidatus Uabimicrobium sp. HlEnr_7]|uniref:hypothetical protein n=1 Tax=Candidatus Uabimicrobium helgolandensis TaxID=3095367 RepID=UPI0035569FB4
MESILQTLPIQISYATKKKLEGYKLVKKLQSLDDTRDHCLIEKVDSGAQFILKIGWSNTTFDMKKCVKLIPFLNKLDISEVVIDYWSESFPHKSIQGVGYSSNDSSTLWIVKPNTTEKQPLQNIFPNNKIQKIRQLLVIAIQFSKFLAFLLKSNIGKIFLTNQNNHFWYFTHWVLHNTYIKKDGSAFIKNFGLASCWIDHRENFFGAKYDRMYPSSHIPYQISYFSCLKALQQEDPCSAKAEICIIATFLFLGCGGKIINTKEYDFSSIELEDDKLLSAILNIIKKSMSAKYQDVQEMTKDLIAAVTILNK